MPPDKIGTSTTTNSSHHHQRQRYTHPPSGGHNDQDSAESTHQHSPKQKTEGRNYNVFTNTFPSTKITHNQHAQTTRHIEVAKANHHDMTHRGRQGQRPQSRQRGGHQDPSEQATHIISLATSHTERDDTARPTRYTQLATHQASIHREPSSQQACARRWE